MSVGSFASSSFLFNAGLLKHCTTARRRGVGGLRVVRAAVLAAALLTPCQALSYALTAQPPQDHSPPAAAHTAAGHVLLRSNSSPRFRRLGGDDGVNDVEAGGTVVVSTVSLFVTNRLRCVLCVLLACRVHGFVG
eukprot:GHVS01068313.1.p1 GENE.GHVS01068313.1~~GHVS01068313.1.p1  ORF type:complete len:135 (-),score=20.84 GHVS01068313.1:91-495(-)